MRDLAEQPSLEAYIRGQCAFYDQRRDKRTHAGWVPVLCQARPVVLVHSRSTPGHVFGACPRHLAEVVGPSKTEALLAGEAVEGYDHIERIEEGEPDAR